MQLHDRPTPENIEQTSLPEHPRCGLEELPPPDLTDPVIEAYKRDVDRTLLRAKLRLTVAERFEQFDRFGEDAAEISAAGDRARAAGKQA